MRKEVIQTEAAPQVVGPYCQAISSNGFVFTSGQLAIDPSTNQLVSGSIQTQTEQIFKNLSAVLTEAGTSLNNCVKLTVFLTDLGHFSEVNTIYQQYLGGTKQLAARSCVEVSRLPLNAQIEIEAIAIR